MQRAIGCDAQATLRRLTTVAPLCLVVGAALTRNVEAQDYASIEAVPSTDAEPAFERGAVRPRVPGP
jgi:hypothetical protein